MTNPFMTTTGSIFDTRPQSEVAVDRDYQAQVKYDKIICEKVRHLKAIVDFPLKKGVQYRIVTTHAFNAVVVLDEILSKYKITKMYIAVYRMNRRSVNRLTSVITEYGIPAKIILSNFFRENKRYEKWCEELTAFCDTCDNTEIGFYCNHAKVLLIKTKCGKHIVFEGSGNLSDNARIEQYILEDCEITYNFHAKWIEDVLVMRNTK